MASQNRPSSFEAFALLRRLRVTARKHSALTPPDTAPAIPASPPALDFDGYLKFIFYKRSSSTIVGGLLRYLQRRGSKYNSKIQSGKIVMSSRLSIFLLLFVFFIVTGLFPNLLLYVLLYTFGLGYPLLFLNTVFLYFLAALPLFAALQNRPRSWMRVALTASIIPGVAIVPPLLTRILAIYKMEQFRAHDVSAQLPKTPKAIEIVSDQQYSLKNAPCDTLCQRLLLSGSIDIVRVTRTPSVVGRAPSIQLDYKIEQQPSCPQAFGEGETILPQTKDALVSGTCFISHAVDVAPISTRIIIRKTSSPSPKNLAEDLMAASGTAKEVQTLEIFVSEADRSSLLLRQTQVKFSHWKIPTALFFDSCYGLCLGYPVFIRTESTLNPFDADELSLNALNIKDKEPRPLLDPAMRVLAVLDGPAEFMNGDQRLVINEWAKEKTFNCRSDECRRLTDKDKEVLLRLVKDSRVTDFLYVGAVIASNREFVAANFDFFLDEMETRGANSQFSNQIGSIIPKLANEIVESKRDRILALIRANAWTWSHGIATVSGKLGLDTADLISERLLEQNSADAAALAACVADEAIGTKLVPSLLAYLERLPISNSRPSDASRRIVKALARFGHSDQAQELLLSRYPKFADISSFGQPGRDVLARYAADVLRDVNACYRA